MLIGLKVMLEDLIAWNHIGRPVNRSSEPENPIIYVLHSQILES